MGRILNMMNDGFAIWSCCPIRGDDGLVHVFATIWEHKGEYTLPPQVGMARGSRIARFTAERPEGPYTFREVCLAPAGGDAWDGTCVSEGFVYRVGERYAMYYFGSNGNSQPRKPIQVGLAVADSLEGPWERVSKENPIVPVGERDEDIDSDITANPAMVMPPSGGFWLYYKGNSKAVKAANKARTDLSGHAAQHGVFRTVCLARAEKLEGPYIKYEGNPVIRYERSDFEDPYVWHDGERFHMLGHDLSVLEYGAGIYLQSFDGIHWS
ncbi:MAG: glycoside hydrolase family protein, partial [Spirochaetota bacterium]